MFNNNSKLLINNLSDSVFYIAPVIADFERLLGNVVGNEVTANRTFVEGDIGKVIVIKEARNFATYREAPLSWNGVINSINAGKAVVSSPRGDILINVFEKEVLIGTNNFDIIQTALDYCATMSYTKLKLDFNGTAYIVPEFSSMANAQTHNNTFYRGLRITNNITIEGISKHTTILKWGVEDVMKTTASSTEFNYAAFVWGSFEPTLKKIRIEAPDRLTTKTNTLVSCLRSFQIASGRKSFELNDVNIGGYGLNPRDNGWYAGFECSLGGDIGYTVMNKFINSSITARNPINQFNQNSYKTLFIRNLEVIGGGSKEYRDPYINAVTISSGSTTLTVEDPYFSWYDFNSYNGSNAIFTIDGTFNAEIVTIINCKTATINLPAPSTFTSKTIFVKGRGNGAEGHAIYCHPNVGLDINGLTVSNCLKLSMHDYSGGGQSGVRQKADLKNIVVTPFVPNATDTLFGVPFISAPWEMSGANLGSLPYFDIDGVNLTFYSNDYIPVRLRNSHIINGQFGGGTVFNCTGTLDSRTSANVSFDTINGANVFIYLTQLVDGSGKTDTLTNLGLTNRIGSIVCFSGTNINITNANIKDIEFYRALAGPGRSFTFTNLDIRFRDNVVFGFTGGWTSPEITTFISQSTFTNCTCSAAVHWLIPAQIQPFFTIT